MEQLPPLGTAVGEIIKPTLQLYAPLLLKNKEKIRSVKKETHSYGLHERQQLDVYTTPAPSVRNGRIPVLIFCYGGGLTMGDKTFPGYADDLCHANIAYFFSQHGYSVVVPDYRLVGKHDAKFPSGGEDIALTVEWIEKHADTFGTDPIDLFVMGNSAGGLHTSTFLLHKSFATTRSRLLSGNGTRLRGAILLSVPFHMKSSHGYRAETNETYFGEDVAANVPLGLLRTAKEAGSIDFMEAGVRTFILNGDLDSVDELFQTRDDFIEEWLSIGTKASRSSLAVDIMIGHNHISPFCSLGTGIEEEEAWGLQVVAFCDNVRLFKPSGTK